jgi:hypothetical protein
LRFKGLADFDNLIVCNGSEGMPDKGTTSHRYLNFDTDSVTPALSEINKNRLRHDFTAYALLRSSCADKFATAAGLDTRFGQLARQATRHKFASTGKATSGPPRSTDAIADRLM